MLGRTASIARLGLRAASSDAMGPRSSGIFTVNKVTLMGRVGEAPEPRAVGEGEVVNFRLATNDPAWSKGADGWEAGTVANWHNIRVSGGLATVAKTKIKKGSLVYLEGTLSSRKYDDKDGNPRVFTEVKVEKNGPLWILPVTSPSSE